MENKHEQAEKDYIKGLKYREIAEKYGVSEATVKSWKTRYKWIRGQKNSTHTKSQKSMHTKKAKKEPKEKGQNTVTKNELRIVSENEELNEKQKQFCVFFVKCHNMTKAYMRAYGSDYATAAASASRLLRNVKIRSFIEMLKNEKKNQDYFCAEDLVQMYMDIAFADVGDVANFTPEGIEIRQNFDPTTVKKIKDTKYGYSIEMQDKFKAMEWLGNYFEINPEAKRRKEYDSLRMTQLQLQIDAEKRRDELETDEKEEYGAVFLPQTMEIEDGDELEIEDSLETAT